MSGFLSSKPRSLVLGLDVGTTTTKAALFNLNDFGVPLAIARRSTATTQPAPGWSEVSPNQVLATVFDCIREVVAAVPNDDIVAIGTSGTACGVWLIDADGRPVRNAILWNDGRAAGILREWREVGLIDTIFERSGNVPFPGYTLPVLRWLQLNEPEILESAATFLFCKDWIRLALTGAVTSDETDASYAPFDIRSRAWDLELFDLCGVTAQSRLLPELAPVDSTLRLLPHVAGTLGLREGIPVAVGATDIISGLVGGGAIRPGHAVSILGTSANSSVVTDGPDFTPFGVGIMAAAPQGRWARTMLNTSGSTTLDWAASLLSDGDIARLLTLADSGSAADDRPVLVPYLARAGVVSPRPDPAARGVLVGLRSDQSSAAVARACVEGLAFAVADSYAAMSTQVTELTVVGGASRSDLLVQTIANSVGVPVHRLEGEEFGARGVALLAAHAAGFLDDGRLESVSESVSVRRTFAPDPAATETALARYRLARDSTADLWGKW